MSIGAHGFVPSNILKDSKDSQDESFSLFGGTSMAAPIVSGSAAILMQEMKKQYYDYDSFTIKNILMSTATDLQNDPFTQGSGLVNIESALDYVHGNNGVFIVHNDASYKNIKKILEPSIINTNSTKIGLEKFQLPSKSFPMTSWFAGHLFPGERTTTTFTIDNPTNKTITINLEPKNLSLIKNSTLDGKTNPQQQDSILNKTGIFVPNYIKLSDVKDKEELIDFFDNQNSIPDDSSLMILNLNFPFSQFMNSTANIYADDL